MASTVATERPTGGFVFENCQRNKFLESQGYQLPKAHSTGTTIAGVIFKDGVVLGADTRATDGFTVADKNCSKIHYISSNIYCCGAGTAADTEMVTLMLSSEIELHRLNTSRKPRVCTANNILRQLLRRYHGNLHAALVLGGADVTGPRLYCTYPQGSTDKIPFAAMGSGSLDAMAVFEDRFKPDMMREEAIKLVRDAVAAGIFNDLGSGSNVDLCVITKDKVDHLRPYEEPNKKGVRQGKYHYKRGTTAVLRREVKKIPLENVETEVKKR